MAGKGQPKTGGRKKGTPNKLTRDIRKAVLDAFEAGGKAEITLKDGKKRAITSPGGADWLREQMILRPEAFMTLLGKVLPTQITGPDDGPVQVAEIKLIGVRADEASD